MTRILVDPQIADRTKGRRIVHRIEYHCERIRDGIDASIGGAAAIVHDNAYDACAKSIGHWGESERAGSVGVGVVDRWVGKDRRVAGDCGDCQDLARFAGRTRGNSAEVNRLGAWIFIGNNVTDGIDRRRLVHRVDRDSKRVGDRINATVGSAPIVQHDYINGGGAKFVRDRGKIKAPGGTWAGVGDRRIRNEGRIAGSGNYRQMLAGFIGRSGADPAQVDGLLPCILVDGEIAKRVECRRIIHRIDYHQESVG